MTAIVNGIQTVAGYVYNVAESTVIGIGAVGQTVVTGTIDVLKAIFLGQ